MGSTCISKSICGQCSWTCWGTLGNKISNFSYILGVLWLWSLCSCIVLSLYSCKLERLKRKRTNSSIERTTELDTTTTCQRVQPRDVGRIWGEIQLLKSLWELCNQVTIWKKSEDQRSHVPKARVIPLSMVHVFPHTLSKSKIILCIVAQPSFTHKLVWIMMDCSLSVSISIKCFFISRVTTKIVV